MITCYVSTLITLLALLVGFFQSIFKFPIFESSHVTYMIFVSILYCFTETLVIFFFVGTGVSVKEYTKMHNLPPDYHKRSITIKRKVYPPLMLNLLFMVILFILVGAVDTHRFPMWLYWILFVACIGHYTKVKIQQNECFRENTQLILDMSGIDRKVV
jgi:hypothetical protein